MSQPPTWAPARGERYQEWIGTLVSTGFIIWDRLEIVDDYIAVQVGASSTGRVIDSDVDFAVVRSDTTTNSVLTPAIVVGKKLQLYISEAACRLRAYTAGPSVLINGKICSSTNELFLPAKSSVILTAVDSQSWKAQVFNHEGLAIQTTPITRGTTTTVTEKGVQELTAVASTGAQIAEDTKHVTVTSGTSTDIILLPSPVVGKKVTGYVGATGFALATTLPSGSSSAVKINNVVCSGGAAEAAIPATTYWEATCVSSTEWILLALTELGAVVTAIVPS